MGNVVVPPGRRASAGGAASIAPRTVTAGADQGDVAATFNADGVTVAAGEVVFYAYGGATYVYGGATGAPVTTAQPGDFQQLQVAMGGHTVATGTVAAGDGEVVLAEVPHRGEVQHLSLRTTTELEGAGEIVLRDRDPAGAADAVVARWTRDAAGDWHFRAYEADPATTFGHTLTPPHRSTLRVRLTDGHAAAVDGLALRLGEWPAQSRPALLEGVDLAGAGDLDQLAAALAEGVDLGAATVERQWSVVVALTDQEAIEARDFGITVGGAPLKWTVDAGTPPSRAADQTVAPNTDWDATVDRAQSVMMHCRVTFPSTPADGCLVEHGGPTTGLLLALRDGGTVLRLRAGDGAASPDPNDIAILDVTPPADIAEHDILLFADPAAGEVRLWIDGVDQGTATTGDGSSFRDGEWAGGGTGGYGPLATEYDCGDGAEPTAGWPGTVVSDLALWEDPAADQTGALFSGARYAAGMLAEAVDTAVAGLRAERAGGDIALIAFDYGAAGDIAITGAGVFEDGQGAATGTDGTLYAAVEPAAPTLAVTIDDTAAAGVAALGFTIGDQAVDLTGVTLAATAATLVLTVDDAGAATVDGLGFTIGGQAVDLTGVDFGVVSTRADLALQLANSPDLADVTDDGSATLTLTTAATGPVDAVLALTGAGWLLAGAAAVETAATPTDGTGAVDRATLATELAGSPDLASVVDDGVDTLTIAPATAGWDGRIAITGAGALLDGGDAAAESAATLTQPEVATVAITVTDGDAATVDGVGFEIGRETIDLSGATLPAADGDGLAAELETAPQIASASYDAGSDTLTVVGTRRLDGTPLTRERVESAAVHVTGAGVLTAAGAAVESGSAITQPYVGGRARVAVTIDDAEAARAAALGITVGGAAPDTSAVAWFVATGGERLAERIGWVPGVTASWDDGAGAVTITPDALGAAAEIAITGAGVLLDAGGAALGTDGSPGTTDVGEIAVTAAAPGPQNTLWADAGASPVTAGGNPRGTLVHYGSPGTGETAPHEVGWSPPLHPTPVVERDARLTLELAGCTAGAIDWSVQWRP